MIAIALANTTGSIDVVGILNNIVYWAFNFLLIFGVIFILYAAFLFLTAAGDPEKINKAKSQLMWAIVAIAVALIAKGVTSIVENLLGVGSPSIPPGPGVD